MTINTFLIISTIIMLFISLSTFIRKIYPLIKALKNSKSIDRFNNIGERFKVVMVQVFGHERLLKKPMAGIVHFFIFSAFIIFMLDIVETIIKLIEPSFSLGTFVGFVVNLWVIFLLIGVSFALYQRLIIKPNRFEGSNPTDAIKILVLIGLIGIGIVLHTSFYNIIASPVFGVDYHNNGAFITNALTKLWIVLGLDSPNIAQIGYAIGYFMDIGIVIYFLSYLPGSKHFHIITGAPSVFFLNLDQPSGTPLSINNVTNKEQKNVDTDMTINTINDFTWKDILDFYSCTECGRCQDVCPAYNSGSILNPKQIITDLRDTMKSYLRGKNNSLVIETLAGNVIPKEALWACTTCRACEEACPIFIEHVPKIVGMRASLVEQGDVERNVQETFRYWYEHGNAYKEFNNARPLKRNNISNLKFKDARKESVDLLWFLGDVASFERVPGVVRAVESLSLLLKEAELDVGLLYDGEKNSGNDVLRMGEQGLFEHLAKQNILTMKDAKFNRIITSDPHSYNTLKNDYPKLGFNKPVLHYTQLLLELIKEGRLTIKNKVNIRATFHDACYLGRWNGVFEQPRELLDLCGVEIVEMPRNRMGSLCCGAGGGRFFMNETGTEERPSEQRIKEAVELDEVTYFVVTCPKDVVMYSAAVDSLRYNEKIEVIDIAEIVARAVGVNVHVNVS